MDITELKLARSALLKQYMEINEQMKALEKRQIEVKGSIRFLDQTIEGLSRSP